MIAHIANIDKIFIWDFKFIIRHTVINSFVMFFQKTFCNSKDILGLISIVDNRVVNCYYIICCRNIIMRSCQVPIYWGFVFMPSYILV